LILLYLNHPIHHCALLFPPYPSCLLLYFLLSITILLSTPSIHSHIWAFVNWLQSETTWVFDGFTFYCLPLVPYYPPSSSILTRLQK
jgi:hypothetical protein